MNTVSVIAAAIVVALFSGCSFNAGYNPNYFPSKPAPLGIEGKGLVVMTTGDAQWTYNGRPTSMTGGATHLTLPLGEITRQVALLVFGAAFTEGADFSHDASSTAPYRAVIKPKVATFSYAYNSLKNLGFAITPQVQVQLNMELLAPDGTKILEKSYHSGVLDGGSYVVSGQPAEKVNQTLHQSLFQLMSQAAADTKVALAR